MQFITTQLNEDIGMRIGHAPANLNNPRHAAMLELQNRAAAYRENPTPAPAAYAVDTNSLEDIT